jgi:excisionase family DNA binding protein
MIDLTTELMTWLRSTDTRSLMKEIVAEAIQSELRSALEDELIDVERAAAMLNMTEGALRKAVERGQIPCQRVGSRVRFRRTDLLRDTRAIAASASTPGDRSVARPLAAPRTASGTTSGPRRDRKIAS